MKKLFEIVALSLLTYQRLHYSTHPLTCQQFSENFYKVTIFLSALDFPRSLLYNNII